MPEGQRHLTYPERCQIHALMKSGLSAAAVARQLGRGPSSVPRGAAGMRSSEASPKRPPARDRILRLAQRRQIDAVLVTEVSRWGRSTQDLLATLHQLAGWNVSVVAMNGMALELGTPHGRMMATVLAGVAQFERELISERVRSGLAAARERGVKLGRQPGQRPKADRLAPKVLQAVADGRSYRWIARDLGISKNTVLDIVKRHRGNPSA